VDEVDAPHSLQDEKASFIGFEPALLKRESKGSPVKIDENEHHIRGNDEAPFVILCELCLLGMTGVQAPQAYRRPSKAFPQLD
jgi:hypothetical protein